MTRTGRHGIPPPDTRWGQIRRHLAEVKAPEFRFTQLLTAARDSGAETFDEIRSLPAPLRYELTERFGPLLQPLVPVVVERGDQVEKVLFDTASGARIETVVAHYRGGWSSMCISSQAGCGLGCTFCATGAVGLVRQLTADEILAQVMHGHWRRSGVGRPESIALMGMGEALANPNLFDALKMLVAPEFGAFSPRRITVSTVGFAPNLARLLREQPQITPTLSVHSPFPEQRAAIIPLERRFPLAQNLELLDRHTIDVRRKAYLAYLLIDGVNDTDDHLEALTRLVRTRIRPELFHVNVIRYNEAAGADPAFRAPTAAATERFVDELRRRRIHATRRRQVGADIDAACGQLHARYLSGGAISGGTSGAPTQTALGAPTVAAARARTAEGGGLPGG